MISSLALVAVFTSALAAQALPCVQFDTSWNLYAFGGSSDVNLGQNTSWSSPSPKTLTMTGRPPWTGNSTQCILSQTNNAMYVLGSDASDLSTIYIYSFSSSSWSTQTTSSPPPNLGSRSASVLDHDTNVVFTLPSGSGQSLYQLDMSSVMDSASSSSLGWEAVENPSFSTDGYTPTAAQASNHINYFGVPSTAAGSADIFVVHYAYFQPSPQSYPSQNNGASLPDTAGQAFSIPLATNNVPLQMVFIPNDFSNTFIVTHWTDPGNYATTSDAPFAQNLINSTQILPAPSSQDTQAAYAASDTALVQIDSAGNIYYVTGAVPGDYTVATGATWTKMSYTLSGTNGVVTGSNSSSSSNSTSTSTTGTAAASPTSSSTTSMTTSMSASPTASGSASTSGAASKAARVSRLSNGTIGLTLGLVAIGGAMMY